MRIRKIRGHNRRHRHIEKWRLKSLNINWDFLERYANEYVEIIVHPWCDISLIKSEIPQPKRKTKALILNGLLDIYDSWKKQLDKTGQPYYLKIWLYEPRFSKSQVVCGFGARISHYENLFNKSDNSKTFRPNSFAYINNRLDALSWNLYLDEDHFDNDHVGRPELYVTSANYEESKRWFHRLLKKPHTTTKIDESTEIYSFKRGDLWIGG